MSTTKNTQITLTVNFNKGIVLVFLLFLPVLLKLGFWQLARAEEKRAMQAAYIEQQAQAPTPFAVETYQQLPVYTRLEIEGQFDNQHIWLLDNKIRHGQVGYEIISPFITQHNTRVLVNRGWLPAAAHRQQLPVVPAVKGVVNIVAGVYPITKNPLLTPNLQHVSQVATWPQVIVQANAALMAEQLGQPLWNRILLLEESSAGAFTTEWQPINMHAEKHTGYAVQWFAMAFALIIVFICASSNLFAWLSFKLRLTNE